MTAAVSSNLNMQLLPPDALRLYYRLNTYLRENDNKAFYKMLEFKYELNKSDDEVMVYLIKIMSEKHPAQLQELLRAFIR